MQTMRTSANNMAWILKKLHPGKENDIPEKEPSDKMNFIR
jgi:hypothetical protein